MQKKNLRVGDTCVWYQHGDRANQPSAAIVTKIGGNGAVDLQVFVVGAAGTLHKRNVYWIDSDILKDKPQAAVSFGAWDYVQSAQEQLDKMEAERLAVIRKNEEHQALMNEQRRSEDDKNAASILKMHASGKAPVDIALEMSQKTGAEWSYQRVNNILKKSGAKNLPTAT